MLFTIKKYAAEKKRLSTYLNSSLRIFKALIPMKDSFLLEIVPLNPIHTHERTVDRSSESDPHAGINYSYAYQATGVGAWMMNTTDHPLKREKSRLGQRERVVCFHSCVSTNEQ